MGHLLFLLNFNDIENMVLLSETRLFANDAVLNASGSSKEETVYKSVHKSNKDVLSYMTIFEKTALFSTLRKAIPKQCCLKYQKNLLNVTT